MYLLQTKVQNILHIVQMNSERLDRLSALLEGLAPEVSLVTACPDRGDVQPDFGSSSGLCIYLLTAGSVHFRWAGGSMPVEAPALVALRSSRRPIVENMPSPDGERPICVYTNLAGPVAALFLNEFAGPRVLSLTRDEPSLSLVVAMIKAELASPRCGQPALLNRAGGILFIGLLRYLVAHPNPHGSGLFNGLADHRIAKVLVAMHQHPGMDWSLERLANEAGMSRTAFASTFREVMKITPGKYLSAIRLAMAKRAVEQGKGLKEAARGIGYNNASALSRALSRARLQESQI